MCLQFWTPRQKLVDCYAVRQDNIGWMALIMLLPWSTKLNSSWSQFQDMSQSFVNEMKVMSLIYYSSCFSRKAVAQPQTSIEWVQINLLLAVDLQSRGEKNLLSQWEENAVKLQTVKKYCGLQVNAVSLKLKIISHLNLSLVIMSALI